MKIKELTFAEAIEAAKSGYRIAYSHNDEGFMLSEEGDLWTIEDYAKRNSAAGVAVRPFMTHSDILKVTGPRWHIIYDTMSFQDACRFSKDTGTTMKRSQGTVRLRISEIGEIDCTVVGGNSAIVRRLTMDDLKATDWTPDIDSVKVNERAITPQQQQYVDLKG